MEMIKKISVFAVCALFAMACVEAPESDEAEVSEAKEVKESTNEAKNYDINLEESKVQWIGTKVTGQHPGEVDLKDGRLKIKDGKIVGGQFTFDMATIRATDENMDEEGNEKLTGHLRSPDFFDVEKYADGKFVITEVTKIKGDAGEDTAKSEEDSALYHTTGKELKLKDATHMVTGNLTLKDTTNSISFPAIIQVIDNKVTAKSNFNFDRTKWNVHYGADKSLGDKMIYATVNLDLDLVAYPEGEEKEMETDDVSAQN